MAGSILITGGSGTLGKALAPLLIADGWTVRRAAILLAIPLVVFFTRIGLRGSLIGLIIVYASQTVPVTIHIFRSYFNSITESLEESATLEGCNRFQVMRYISIPLAMPAIMSTGLFVFMIAWNEFLFALLFLVDKGGSWTVSLGLSQLAKSTIEVPTTVVMAGAVILTVPVIALFFLTERLLVEGLTAGQRRADKGRARISELAERTPSDPPETPLTETR